MRSRAGGAAGIRVLGAIVATAAIPAISAMAAITGLVALASPAAAFTIHSPLAVVGADAAATAAVTASLSRRFRDLRRLPSLAAAQEAARAEDGPAIALVVSATQQPQQITAYGVGMTACDVSLTIELFDLPEARSLLSHRRAKRAPSCPEALEAAVGGLADELMVSLESYRRDGLESPGREVTAELQPPGTPQEREALVRELKTLKGIRSARLLPDGRIVLTVYRELRDLAREIDALPDLTVARIDDDRLTLRSALATAAALESAPRPQDDPPRSLPREAAAERLSSAVHVAPALPGSANVPVTFHDKWALVVGISRFADATIPTLGYARKDAEAFAATLNAPEIGRFQPDRVVTLLDERATLRNLKSQIELLARVVEPDDLFVVFLSTHAAPGEVDMAGDPYFVAFDTEKASLYATAFAMRELTDALVHRIRARHVVAFLDACYTGQILARSRLALAGSKAMTYEAAAGGSGGSDGSGGGVAPLSWSREWATLAGTAPKPLAAPAAEAAGTATATRSPLAGEGKSLVLMTSSDGTEPSWESDTLGHGVFTYYLMEGLRDSQGLASVEELFDRLRDRVARQVAAEKQRNQQPRLFFSDHPSVAIGTPAGSARGGNRP